jgi:ribosomal protein S18 acetylase RimI-like enzyme
MFPRHIEEAALSAWPATQQIIYDGWLLRFGGGYTRRSNSVTPLYESTLDLDAKITYCAARYAERNLRPTFRITPFDTSSGLDRALERRSYRLEAPSLTQASDLSRLTLTPPDGNLRDDPLDSWIVQFCRLRDDSPAILQAHRAILQTIPSRCFLGTLADASGAVVGCGVAVLEGAYVGLFDVIVDPARRGQGYGSALMAGLLHWARTGGARYAYLQVMAQNAPARHIYEAKFGFETVYEYWYRVLDS